jgi:hypothetical protein
MKQALHQQLRFECHYGRLEEKSFTQGQTWPAYLIVDLTGPKLRCQPAVYRTNKLRSKDNPQFGTDLKSS